MTNVVSKRFLGRFAAQLVAVFVGLSPALAEECQWKFSSGGRANFANLATGARLGFLRFGDFDGDGKTDVFFSGPVPGAAAGSTRAQWRFAPAGNLPFKTLSQGPHVDDSRLDNSNFALGDFDGDGRSDVFVVKPLSLGVRQMEFSPGGLRDFQNLSELPDRFGLDLSRPGFGDFDGDGRTDVFAWVRGDSPVQYVFSSGGTGQFQELAKDRVPTGFGDFNGDGKSDAFRIAEEVGNGAQWMYYSGGTGERQNLAIGPGARPGFGDFDGDGKTDVFSTEDLGNGTHQWKFSSGGAGDFQLLAVGPPLFDDNGQINLGFGDFDGDRRTDVFVSVCP